MRHPPVCVANPSRLFRIVNHPYNGHSANVYEPREPGTIIAGAPEHSYRYGFRQLSLWHPPRCYLLVSLVRNLAHGDCSSGHHVLYGGAVDRRVLDCFSRLRWSVCSRGKYV